MPPLRELLKRHRWLLPPRNRHPRLRVGVVLAAAEHLLEVLAPVVVIQLVVPCDSPNRKTGFDSSQRAVEQSRERSVPDCSSFHRTEADDEVADLLLV